MIEYVLAATAFIATIIYMINWFEGIDLLRSKYNLHWRSYELSASRDKKPRRGKDSYGILKGYLFAFKDWNIKDKKLRRYQIRCRFAAVVCIVSLGILFFLG